MSEQKNKTFGYVRVVAVNKGEVVHICPNTLHHPDPQEQLRLQNVVTVDLLNNLINDESYEDCQVLVVFHNDGDTFTIEHSMMIQPGFKEFWRKRISKKIEDNHNSLRDEIHIQERIDLWESTYGEAFTPVTL
ncbi:MULTISPECIES: hypothetical protein [Bacillus]|uniref:hypothetical protein n=1 Tax=Bacillus TaxID=1386 RepID=UPI0002D5E177|nr:MULTISPECIES: hypothetical protein [Bacillus]